MNLEKITQSFLIAVCVVSLVVLVEHNFLGNGAGAGSLDAYADTLAGQRETSIPPAVWQASPVHVVLLLNSTCRFCDESMPLYQKFAALRREYGVRFSLVAVGAEPPDVLREYLRQNKINVDSVLQVRSGFATVRFTPAVFIVNSQGIIQKAFLGKLNEGSEKQLLQLVEAL